MLRVDVSKNSNTALPSLDGALVTSTTTSTLASASGSPSTVIVLTPDDGEADTASWPRPRKGDELFPDEPAAADNHDFHVRSPYLSPESGPLIELRIDQRAARARTWLAFTLTF